MVVSTPRTEPTEERLRRRLGFWGLTAIGFSNIVGSGWLFAALYAAQTAGPAALLAWVAAGVLVILVALVMVELGASRPEGGGTVRWPLQSSGRLVGSVIGVSVLLTVGGTAAEITAILQYAAHYLPWLYSGKQITFAGTGVAVVLAALLSALNWYGVRLFARVNNVLTVVKIAVPLLTVVALVISGFAPHHLTDHGGFAPYGYGAVLSALAVGGVVYSVNGFQAAADFAGEARDPQRTVPRAIIAGIELAVLVYLALQLAFLFAVPDSMLGGGWKGVNFDSPFGQLALILNLQWLSLLLYADAVIPPGGSGYVGVAIDARHTYALARNGVLPRSFAEVEPRSGIPRKALLLNLAVIVVFLLPYSGWQDVVSVVGDLYLLTYAAVAVSAAAFLAPGGPIGVGPGARPPLHRPRQLHGGHRVRVLVRLDPSANRATAHPDRGAAVPAGVATAPERCPHHRAAPRRLGGGVPRRPAGRVGARQLRRLGNHRRTLGHGVGGSACGLRLCRCGPLESSLHRHLSKVLAVSEVKDRRSGVSRCPAEVGP